jgi:hypothetical protein
MGILSQIVASNSINQNPNATEPTADHTSLASQPTEDSNAPPEICDMCGGVIFWQSVYDDGIWRCGSCEHPPSYSLAKNWIVEGLTLEQDREWRRAAELDRSNATEPAAAGSFPDRSRSAVIVGSAGQKLDEPRPSV